tara:strand:- start:107 stop:1111 length:1005 start_codon:yes stop_codon:yes gene_type:complete
MARGDSFRSPLPSDITFPLLLAAYAIVANEAKFGPELTNFSLAMVGYVTARMLAADASSAQLNAAFKIGGWICVAALALDTVYRLQHPQAPNEAMYSELIGTNLEFYLYKFGSLMFADSNTVALVALCFIGLGTYIRAIGGPRNTILLMAFAAIVLLTFSRSAYVALAALAVVALLSQFTRVARAVFVCLAGAASCITLMTVAPSSLDGSLLTKIGILNNAWEIAGQVGLYEWLFGIGLGQTESYTYTPAHVLPVTYVSEMGVVGSLLVLMWLAQLVARNRAILLFLLPAMVASMSYFLYAGTAFFTVPLALAVAFSRSSNGTCVTALPQHRQS